MNQLDHSYFQQRLSAYADGELEPSARAQVEEHLHTCPECRNRLQEIEKLSEFITRESGLAESEYWEQAAQRIERAVEEAQPKIIDLKAERTRRRTSPWWWRAPAIAASVLFLGYITLNESSILRDEVLTPTQPSETEPAPQLKAVRSETDTKTSGSGEELPIERAITPAPAMSEPGQESVDKLSKDQGVQLEAAQVERTGRQESGPSREESIELNQSIITLAEEKTVDRSGARTSPDLASASKPEVVPQVVEPEKTAPESEQLAEDAVLRKEDQKYRAEKREKGTSILRDTPQVASELNSVEEPEATGLSKLQSEKLTYWLARRDSLAQQAAKIERQNLSPIGQVLRLAEAPAKAGVKTALTGEEPQQKTQNQTEAGLLEAWYQICRLTSDSTEVNRGVSFIEKVATDQESSNRESARNYLKQLGRH